MEISKIRERIKNLILFHTDKFDSKNVVDVALAEKIAANSVVALFDYLNSLDTKTEITAIKTTLEEDSSWQNLDEYLEVVNLEK